LSEFIVFLDHGEEKVCQLSVTNEDPEK